MTGSKHPSPRMPDEGIIVLDPQVYEEVVKLIKPKLIPPERNISIFLWEMSRQTVTDLIVENYGDVMGSSEAGEHLEVVVGNSWSTMERYERTVGAVGEIAYNFVPCLAWLAGRRNVERNFSLKNIGSGHLGVQVMIYLDTLSRGVI
jgi:hypothetical protein